MDNLQPSRINGGNSSTGRKASDFYPTPPEATVALLKFLSLPTQAHIWEPACGEGHMVDVMEAMGYTVTGTDIQRGYDFLTSPLVDCDWIIGRTICQAVCGTQETVRTAAEIPVLERGKAIQAISRNHAHKDTSTDLETRLHGKGTGYDGYGVVCVGFSAKRHYIFSAT